MGGVNLLRSQLVLNDQNGELIFPVVTRRARTTPACRRCRRSRCRKTDVKAIAAYIHSVMAKAAGQGGPPPGPPVVLNIVVGDAAAGQRYFAANCASCHSPTGDLQGLAARYRRTDAAAEHLGRRRRGGGAAAAARAAAAPARTPKPVTVDGDDSPAGERVEGRLDRIDDFIVIADAGRRHAADVPARPATCRRCRSPIRWPDTSSCS